MNPLLEIVLINAVSATALAVLAAVAGRFVRRPAVVHALWVLVLLKLLTPPAVGVATVPKPGEAETPAATVAIAATVAASPDLARTEPIVVERGRPYGLVAVGIWALGSVLILTLAVTRMRRFRRLVARSDEVPRPVRSRAESLAARIGVRCPTLRLVDGRVPPMLWSRIGRPEILLPRALLEGLSAAERDALIAHELSHLRRRDHWVRWLELAALAVFWWHPLVWWARPRMRAAEERSCDALVLRTIPDRSRDYARGLVKTVEFLVGSRSAMPEMATGAGEKRNLKERLTMILEASPPGRLTRTQRWGLAALCVSALLVFPTWADPAPPSAQEQQRILDLEKRAAELERQLREVQAEQRKLEHGRETDLAAERELEARQREVDLATEREWEHQEFSRFERELEAQRREAGLAAERELVELQAAVERERAAREFDLLLDARAMDQEMRQLQEESAKARAAGDEERALVLRGLVQELEQQAELRAVWTGCVCFCGRPRSGVPPPMPRRHRSMPSFSDSTS
jgi:beta-lactamase regulating signal transducer with metallopeptidase domain